jgi:hypothetical protein
MITSQYAKSKLDMGKFPICTVSLEIDAKMPAAKQRFMSEEKLAYCEELLMSFKN